MRMALEVPAAMVAYAKSHEVDVLDVAQFLLDEHGRECGYLLLHPEEDEPEENEGRVSRWQS